MAKLNISLVWKRPENVPSIDAYVNRHVGTNAWWLGHLPSNADVDTAVSQIAQVIPIIPFRQLKIADTLADRIRCSPCLGVWQHQRRLDSSKHLLPSSQLLGPVLQHGPYNR